MRTAIVNAAIGAGYVKGQARLRASMREHCPDVSFLGYTGFPTPGYNTANPYTVKASAMEDAMKQGFDILIWMDCTAVIVRDIQPLVDRIAEHGYYLASSGYKASQTATDKQLEGFGVNRDRAESIADAATGCFGFDMTSDTGRSLLEQWIQAAKDGLFDGSRTHSLNDSADPRFLFGRQDQSAASLLMRIWLLDHLGDLTAYWPPPPTAVMAYKGLWM